MSTAVASRADERVWHFLTGPESTIQDLLQTGFKIGSAIRQDEVAVSSDPNVTTGTHATGHAPQTGSYVVTHSSYFLLVDRQGKVRTSYDSTETEPDSMFADIRQLLRAR